ncbi:hypothetical protein [Acinetobacter sp. ANC 5045]|nr:hypothetical protein [Acinetobacter sp. ANC 5045]
MKNKRVVILGVVLLVLVFLLGFYVHSASKDKLTELEELSKENSMSR